MGQSPEGEACNTVGNGMPLLNGPTEFGGHHPTPVQYTSDARKLAAKGDILFCVRGSTTGKMNWADRPYAIGRGLAAIRPKHGLDTAHYVRAVIEAGLSQLLQAATGSTFPNVSREQLLGMPCHVLGVSEQKRIAEILGALDDKIELNRKMNDSLEQMARALFKSWFVDFDPVHAKAAGRQPCGMDKATAGLFPNSFVDSELGKIPKGWEICSLGSTLDTLETGRRPKGGVGSYTSGIPSVGAESINGIGVFDYSKTKYIPQAFFEGISSGRVMHFDVLLYKDGGKPGEFKPRVGMFAHDFPFPVFCINEHVFRMRSDKLGQCFLYFLVSDQRVLTDFANKGGKAAIPGINQPDVKSTLFVNPPSEIISAFNRSATHLCDRIIRNALENKSLADLRDTLLPKLLDRESEPHAQQ